MDIRELQTAQPHQYYYDMRSQLQRFIYKRSDEAFAAGDAARDAINSPADLDARREFMREKFIECLGGLPAMDTPLNVRVVGVVEHNGLRIEKVIFESRPGAFVTANLYLPEGITSPRGAVLFVCGHHEFAKHADEYTTVCQYLAKAGLVVLAQDPLGQGERFSYHEPSLKTQTVQWGVMEHSYAGAQCLALGDAIAKYFVQDAMRGIDYLMTRPEVDPNKIGITGNSGGGTQSCLMMMCDPRLAAAAPTTFVMNRQTYMYVGTGQDCEQIWPGMTAWGWDHEDVLLMLAPKPVRVLAVKSDFFPVEGTRRTVERCKRLWEMYGKGENLDLIEDSSTHKYTLPLCRAAAEFFSKHLLGQQVTPSDEDIRPIDPPKLWCTSSGQTRGEISGAKFAYEENQERLDQIGKRLAQKPDSERKAKGLEWLEERVFAYRNPCELNPRYIDIMMADDLQVSMAFWWSQDGIFNHGFAIRDYRFIGKELPVTLAVWDGGTTSLDPHIGWIRKTCSNGRAVLVLDVSGEGPLQPHPLGGRDPLEFYGAFYTLTDDLIWLNDSMAAMRTYDVLRALEMIEDWPGLDASNIRGYANGRHGVYIQLAASLDKRIGDVEVVGGIGSYADWVRSRHYDSYDVQSYVFPGILQRLDLPDLERWRRG